MKRLIILRGYPGSGKTTLGQELAKSGELRFIDHNQILNAITEITGNDDGIYDAIHHLEQAIAKKFLDEGQSVVIARGFSLFKSVDPYIQIAKKFHVPDTIFRLDVPLAVLEGRVSSPERQDGWNPTTTPETLSRWMTDHPMEPIDGEIVLDGTKSVDILAEEINSQI
jgi:predicted kinase